MTSISIEEYMVKELVILCDICREKKADAKCFLCDKDICSDHNFGGKEHSNIEINALVYNDKVFEVGVRDILMDCCPDCIDTLNIVMVDKREIINNKLEEDLKNLKEWLLNNIKENSIR